MGSAATELAPLRTRLLSRPMVLFVWLPIACIGALHYATSSDLYWVHDVLRRLYYLPIIVAAFLVGTRGGISAALVVSATYLPHAFVHLGHLAHMDPADTVHKALEVVLYNIVGGVAGVLADRERKRRVELARALDEQRRLQDQLVRAGRLSALGEVVAGVAHEIKNPLHSLKGTAEIIDPVIAEGSDERRMWELHVAELDRLHRIADRFVSFAKPQPPDLQELDLGEVVTQLTELVGVDARKRGIQLSASVPERPTRVRGDRDQLTQVALNIVLNALRAVQDGGAIEVRVEPAGDSGDHHGLVVENDGPPIPSNEVDHLFDPFHAGAEGGAGLGLSISARIVEQHGGFIEAENAGLGVRFSVWLPAI
ncbi:MAG: sensor histidine kinase [Polyangiaceae bacterium]|nr:sensor histidine kinase [Polyangiaceae bacterium]